MSSVPSGGSGGISPDLLAMLASISSSQEDQSNLQQQMLLANQMRQPDPGTHMAGRVAIRNSPLTYVGNMMSNQAARNQQQQTMQQMRDQAAQLRAVRAAYMAQLAQQQQMGQAPAAGAPTQDPSTAQGGYYDPSSMSQEEQALIQSQQDNMPGNTVST